MIFINDGGHVSCESGEYSIMRFRPGDRVRLKAKQDFLMPAEAGIGVVTGDFRVDVYGDTDEISVGVVFPNARVDYLENLFGTCDGMGWWCNEDNLVPADGHGDEVDRWSF